MKYKILLFLALALIVYSCNREDFPIEKESGNRVSIELLKARFHSDSIAFSKSNVQPDFNFRQSLQRKIMWDKAIHSKDGLFYIPVKLSLPANQLATFKNGSKDYGFKVFLRIDPKANIPQYEMLTFFPDKKSNAKIFSGVVLTDDYFVGQTTYSIYPTNNSLQNREGFKKVARLGEEACARVKVGEVCVGNYCSPRYEKVCDDRGKSPFPEEITEEVDDSEMAPGGGGGNGNQDEEENIENKIENPCLKNMVDKIIKKDIEFTIEETLLSIFGENNNFNIVYKENPDLKADNEANAIVTYYTLNNDGKFSKMNIDISLNVNTLPNSSQEYIAMVIVHESIHAYLDYKGYVYNTNQHDIMLSNYVTLMADYLINNFQTPSKDAYALSFLGLYDAYKKSINNQTWESIKNKLGNKLTTESERLNLLDQYQSGYKGKKCQ
ncbi:hypothetical protein ACR79T_18700 [Sphingobacterium spiritivorum]|uniref:hypothetical protein n=1 Tax=Sphingobacterium spiritivorum TaxID=258 RepID=UPI003DA33FF8